MAHVRIISDDPAVFSHGESLCDVFSDDACPDGALANYAVCAQASGIRGALVSAVGIDRPKDEFMRKLHARRMFAQYVARVANFFGAVGDGHGLSARFLPGVLRGKYREDAVQMANGLAARLWGHTETWLPTQIYD